MSIKGFGSGEDKEFVDRLKQRVMDEKPIVQITDAINCFKKVNTKSDKNLDRINNIVRDEITSVLRYKKRLGKEIKNKEILEEISRQVTLWIGNIMDDMEYKLLEEDLLELEEEEGPVLDLIDDLIDQVLNICKISDSEFENLSEGNLSSSIISHETAVDAVVDNSSSMTELSTKQFIKDVYLNVLEDAELQIIETHKDYPLFEEFSSPQLSIDADTEENENILQYLKLQLDNIVHEIPNDLINQLQDKTKNEENSIDKNETNTSLDQIEVYRDKEEQAKNFLELENLTQSDEFDSNFVNEAEDLTQNTIVLLKQDDDTIEIDSLMHETEDSNSNKFEVDDMTVRNVNKQDEIVTKSDFDNVNDEVKIENTRTNNHSIQEKENGVVFADVKDNDSVLSQQKSDVEQIIEDLLDTIMESFDKKSADVNNEVNEEENKKVKFSAIDMDIAMRTKSSTNKSDHELLLQKSSSDYLRVNIDFAPPNENLLSNADESWPLDMPLPSIKVTESVNKSVTSLGNITETNEKGKSSESSYASAQNSEVLIGTKFNSMSTNNNEMNEVLLTPFQNENEIIKETHTIVKTANAKPLANISNRKRKIDTTKNMKRDRKTEGKPLNLVNNKVKRLVKGNTSNKNKKTNQTSNNKSKTLIKTDIANNNNRLKNKTKILYEKNVTKKPVSKEKGKVARTNKTNEKGPALSGVDVKEVITVPNTVDLIQNKAKGDNCRKEKTKKSYSCDEFFLQNEKKKLNQCGIGKIDGCEIQKWCKGLENVIENLETWNAWMNSTCKCVIYLKRKDVFKSSRTEEKARKKWKMLHRNIQQDRVLWKDIKRRNRDGLKSYKKYYDNFKRGANKFQIMCDCSNL
ncbi:putative leucine-rich repeat-containing protein DDB_G0290503 [Battus philenor]|uniref:putative leucine-rich repeat-containing protein DDB_G0290503 n=1 Tax=Battus philenor TaxID=42288 RepID=UPI0035D0B386